MALSIALFLGMLYQHFSDQLMTELETETWLVAQGVELNGMDSVSYTHLDVYKRQAWSPVGRPAPGPSPGKLPRRGSSPRQRPRRTPRRRKSPVSYTHLASTTVTKLLRCRSGASAWTRSTAAMTSESLPTPEGSMMMRSGDVYKRQATVWRWTSASW